MIRKCKEKTLSISQENNWIHQAAKHLLVIRRLLTLNTKKSQQVKEQHVKKRKRIKKFRIQMQIKFTWAYACLLTVFRLLSSFFMPIDCTNESELRGMLCQHTLEVNNRENRTKVTKVNRNHENPQFQVGMKQQKQRGGLWFQFICWGGVSSGGEIDGEFSRFSWLSWGRQAQDYYFLCKIFPNLRQFMRITLAVGSLILKALAAFTMVIFYSSTMLMSSSLFQVKWSITSYEIREYLFLRRNSGIDLDLYDYKHNQVLQFKQVFVDLGSLTAFYFLLWVIRILRGNI